MPIPLSYIPLQPADLTALNTITAGKGVQALVGGVVYIQDDTPSGNNWVSQAGGGDTQASLYYFVEVGTVGPGIFFEMPYVGQFTAI